MAEDSGGEKSLPATGRKKEKAREEGNITRSQDLSAAAALGTGLLALYMLGSSMLRTLLSCGRYYLGQAAQLDLEAVPLSSFAADAAYWLAAGALPFALVMLFSGLVMNFAQVGVLFTTQPLMPKLNKLNPITGFKKFVSTRTFVELVKSLIKLGAVGVIVYLSVRNRLPELLVLSSLTPLAIMHATAGMIASVWWRIVLAMIALGIADYGYQYWQRERDLRMTHQEMKEEMREMEGDPKVKRRVRQLQRELVMKRMMGEVPTADVIVTNPTEYAVALRYNMATMGAPEVIAKGRRLLAQRIRDIGVEHSVPIVQKPELARALYGAVEVGDQVPEKLFRAVAEVLSYVYQIDRRAEKTRERERFLKAHREAV